MATPVPNIGPEPPRLGFTPPWVEHRYRCVVGEQDIVAHGMATNRFHQRIEQRRRLADPVGQGGGVKLDAFTGKDLRLTIKRQVVRIFRHHDMGQKARARNAALYRHGRHRRLVDRAAVPAGQFRPHMADDDKPSGDVVQLLAHVLAHGAHRPAAFSTIGLRCVDHLVPGQMIRQRMTLGLLLRFGCLRLKGGVLRAAHLHLFQHQLQLIEMLGLRAELSPPHRRDLGFQLLDKEALFQCQMPERLDIAWQRILGEHGHGPYYTGRPIQSESAISKSMPLTED